MKYKHWPALSSKISCAQFESFKSKVIFNTHALCCITVKTLCTVHVVVYFRHSSQFVFFYSSHLCSVGFLLCRFSLFVLLRVSSIFFFLNFFLSNFVEFSANSLFGTNIVVIASCLQNKYKFVTILDEEQIVIAVCTNFGWTDFMREMREK